MFNRKDHEHRSERELLLLLLENQIIMALDLTKLNTSVATLSGDVATLIAAVGTGSTAADQAAVDGIAASLDALSAKVTAAIPASPVPPVTPTP